MITIGKRLLHISQRSRIVLFTTLIEVPKESMKYLPPDPDPVVPRKKKLVFDHEFFHRAAKTLPRT